MKKLGIALAAILMVSSAAFAGSTCEGVIDPGTGTGACGPCEATPSGSTYGCVVVRGESNSICIGGDATTGRGCVGFHDASGNNGQFVCSGPDGVTPCLPPGCREAAEAACKEAEEAAQ